MAVIVEKSPQVRYRAMGGSLMPEDTERAQRLDKLLEKRLRQLKADLESKHLMPRSQGKGSLQTYWMVGQALREVAKHEELLVSAELPLLWVAAKQMYLPKELLYEDRGPYREHLYYCYRLSAYPLPLAKKMNWGEWVTIFDSAGINQEPRFDKWFQAKLKGEGSGISREQIRTFVPCLNKMLKDISIEDLEDDELFNCYEASWSLMQLWLEKTDGSPSHGADRLELQSAIEAMMPNLDDVMTGKQTPAEYAAATLRMTETTESEE